MLNRPASFAMSTSVLKALPGKHDIKSRSPSILYLFGLKGYISGQKKGGFPVNTLSCFMISDFCLLLNSTVKFTTEE